MTHINRLLLVLFFVLPALVSSSFAGDNLRWIVRHDAILDASWGSVKSFYQVPKGFVVVASNTPESKTANGEVRRFVTIPALNNGILSPPVGWMKQSDLMSYQEQSKNELARLIAENEAKNPDFTVPEIIKLQGNPEMRKAWFETQRAFDENQKLAEDKRLPEPYFARATILYSLGNYAEALSDYLLGLDSLKNQNDQSAYTHYNTYFVDIRNTIRESLTMPKSLIELGPEKQRRTQYHYNNGYANFWNGNYKRALQHFDNAIQIDWKQPSYWYYRGLAYQRLGDEHKALFNFVFGSHLETHADYLTRKEVSCQLSRLQGKERLFLEAIRNGSPSNTVLQKYISH